ncbi:MAG: glycosyltransferase family 4 protein [Deltaproteobacteria bacterium]|nr:glycosyltransferase family 4 protein [Deltaproteobacteria bacterium]
MTREKIWGSLHPFYEGGAVLGRRVANRRFIQALLRRESRGSNGSFDGYHFFLPTPADCEKLRVELAREYSGLLCSGRLQIRLQRELPAALANTEYHCFHLSDCFTQFSELQRLRNACAVNIFPITGTTHSLSYAEYGRKFLQHLWGGTSTRDAVLATSSAGRSVVLSMYEQLRQGYELEAQAFPNPQIRVLPLGVEASDLPDPEERTLLRRQKRRELGFGLNEDNKDFTGETVFLIFARISYLSKMDLLPLLRACKRAEELGLGPYSLLLAGWQDEGDTFGEEFVRLAKKLGIRARLVLRPDDAERKALYAAADVFLSPSDNLQETFGLTMLEAAAASLPVIASDFDGYRDLVLPGETGLLIPTLGPHATVDTDARSAVIPAAEYHLRLAEQCVVDVPALARAMAELGENPALRQSMGNKARERALRDYSWDRVVDLHLALWEELANTSLPPEEEARLRAARHPSCPSYMDIFGGYYSRRLPGSANTSSSLALSSGDKSGHDLNLEDCRMLRWSTSGEAVYREQDFPVIYSLIEDSLPLPELKRLLFAARRPIALSELAERFAGVGGTDRDFLLLWALKHDLLEII